MITIEVRLYGAFRQYVGQENQLTIVTEPTSVDKLKSTIAVRLGELFPHFINFELINESAVADQKQILPMEHMLTRSCSVSLLPPVCGG